ncbi:MAG: methyltransferase domain-containing protein [Deltaproteobacteria bacterium]|nr:methyltransferase domain-containing protein [Deltaproteobacteria bacterium]
MKKRSHRLEKMARVYDAEILPIWSERFGRLLLRGLKVPPKSMVLDVGAGTGYPALEVLEQMDDQSRLIALEAVGALLDQARKKAGESSGKRIYFRTETLSASLGFADEVYDLVISNLGLLDIPDPQRGLQEFARVTKTGGHVVVTFPLAGTFVEFYDIYREVLIKNDLNEVLGRLEQYIARTPEPEDAARWLENAGLKDVEIEVERFDLLFRSSREFFFAPVIEYGPLAAWKEIAGKGAQMQEIFWQIKEAIDGYFGKRAFGVTINAGCLRGLRPAVLEQKDPLPMGGVYEIAEALEEVTRSGLTRREGSGSIQSAVEELADLLPPDEGSDPHRAVTVGSSSSGSGSFRQAGEGSGASRGGPTRTGSSSAPRPADRTDDEVTRPREDSYPLDLPDALKDAEALESIDTDKGDGEKTKG